MKASSEYMERYRIRNFEADFSDRLKPSAILGYFQQTASAHSEEMGLGFRTLRDQSKFWVLSKIFVCVDRRPAVGEKVLVRTRPHVPSRAIYERSFFLEGEHGATLVRALSRWCVLDTAGRIVPVASLPHGEIDLLEARALDDCDWRIGEAETAGAAPVYSVTAASSEYDVNMHVNNLKYADFVFNAFTVKELAEHELVSFALHYVRQSYEGDRLDFYREEVSRGVFLVTGKRGEETVVAAKVVFADAKNL